MKEYGAEEKVQEANRASARFALEACAQTGAKVGAVGSLGPTTTLLTLSQIPVSVVEQAYFEQALALFEGGIRVFYIEGCQDPLNGCAALTALTRLEDRVATPVQKAVTARVVDNGQMLFGTSLDDFWEVVRPFSPQALGAIGRFDDVRDAIRSLSTLPEARLAAMVDIFAVCFPEGWIESPESLRNKLSSLRDDHDIRVVGTGIISEPDHVRALVEQWDGVVGGRCTVLIDAVGGEGARAT
jgi:5-methyltetrahydrofolate--homocysteine methyltransferase